MNNPTTTRLLHAPEPRWPAAVALLALAGLHLALPKELAAGPPYLVPVVVVALLVPTLLTFHFQRHRLNQIFGFLVLGCVTGAELWSLTLLVLSLPHHTLSPGHLLKAAAALWATNVLVFALWYWRLDAGGPHERSRRGRHRIGAFLFPQMSLDGYEAWTPHFVDYVFLSFNHSTALSPTDTAILSRWAKWLIMLQASISLTTIALLAARAVNIL